MVSPLIISQWPTDPHRDDGATCSLRITMARKGISFIFELIPASVSLFEANLIAEWGSFTGQPSSWVSCWRSTAWNRSPSRQCEPVNLCNCRRSNFTTTARPGSAENSSNGSRPTYFSLTVWTVWPNGPNERRATWRGCWNAATSANLTLFGPQTLPQSISGQGSRGRQSPVATTLTQSTRIWAGGGRISSLIAPRLPVHLREQS